MCGRVRRLWPTARAPFVELDGLTKNGKEQRHKWSVRACGTSHRSAKGVPIFGLNLGPTIVWAGKDGQPNYEQRPGSSSPGCDGDLSRSAICSRL